MKLSEKDLTPYEYRLLTMMLAWGKEVFDMIYDSKYGDYEIGGDDADGRHITIKVIIDRCDNEGSEPLES